MDGGKNNFSKESKGIANSFVFIISMNVKITKNHDMIYSWSVKSMGHNLDLLTISEVVGMGR